MKKLLTLSLVALTACALLSGCKSEEEKAHDKRMAQVEIIRQAFAETQGKYDTKQKHLEEANKICASKGLTDSVINELLSHKDAAEEVQQIMSSYF